MNQEITVKFGIDTVVNGELTGIRVDELNIWSSHFQAIPEDLRDTFETFINSRTKGFLGRQFIFEELDAFIAQRESGYFIIQGKPGIGKSALMAHLVKRRGYIHHFNIALQAINKPEYFLSSVCAQLIALFELDYSAVPNDAYKSGVFLNQLLAKAGKKLKLDERLVIAIDALDEVDGALPTTANILYLPEDLPGGVFIVVTSRPKYRLPLRVTNSREVELKADSESNEKDVRVYIKSHLADKQMQQHLSDWKVTGEEFTEAMLKKSEGYFMYLRHVLPAIKAGRFVHGKLDELPRGLKEYYHEHWKQMQAEHPNFDKFYKPVVCILAVVKEAVSVNLVAAYTELDPDQVLRAIREWYEFLDEYKIKGTVPMYTIYHATFQKFLKEEIDPDLRTYNSMINRYYKKMLKRKLSEQDGESL